MGACARGGHAPAHARIAPALAAAFALCADGPRTTCVVDGDTFWLAGEKIRIADINAPETHGAACPASRRAAQAATRRLIALLNAGPFDLEAGPRDRDRYGRLLRIVTRRGRSIGEELVAEGLAERWQGRRGDWCGGRFTGLSALASAGMGDGNSSASPPPEPPGAAAPSSAAPAASHALAFALRPWLFAAILLLLWPTLDPALVEAPAFLATDPETIEGRLHSLRAGPRGRTALSMATRSNWGHASVRIVGIDAPETHPAALRRRGHTAAKPRPPNSNGCSIRGPSL